MAEKARKRFQKGDWKKLTGVFRYVLPYQAKFWLAFILLILTTLSSLALPYMLKEVIGVFDGNAQFFTTKEQVLTFFGILLIAQAVFSYIRTILTTQVTENTIGDVRSDLYKTLITAPISLFDQSRVGELTSRIASDVTTLQQTVSFTLFQFIRQVIVIVGGITIISIENPQLAVSVLISLPVVVLAGVFFGRFIRKLARQRQDRLAESNVILDETFQAARSVKAYSNEDFEFKRYTDKVAEVIQLSIKNAQYRGLFFGFIGLAFSSVLFFLTWRLATLLQAGALNSGDIVLFVGYAAFIGGSIAGFANTITDLIKTVGATERIEELLAKPREKELAMPNGEPVLETGNIRFADVSFAYPSRPDQTVLKNVSFNIEQGQKVALVGPSGSGKSTIAQLMLRFYQPDTGHVLLNEQNAEHFDLTQYRKNIGFVPQEILLFGGSIRDNIAYGNLEATEDQIIQAAQQANAWEFIQSFDEGLDTFVGERGVQLSGGQKQRVAIARALLKNPPILILDEATSALDAESEHLVQEALEVLMENRTTLIIAHRLSTVRKADKILVLEHGKIVEQGNHDQLLQQAGVYGNLVSLQLR
ncbi:MAG: ATP-binding cassette domain-containing protein [Saprospiraceae bacterium]|nr:ATP-binding cassette domain-containing protein [Saprospiraceae bacterium]